MIDRPVGHTPDLEGLARSFAAETRAAALDSPHTDGLDLDGASEVFEGLPARVRETWDQLGQRIADALAPMADDDAHLHVLLQEFMALVNKELGSPRDPEATYEHALHKHVEGEPQAP